MPREVLYLNTPVTLDASGNGSATVGPAKRFETWKVDRMVTQGTSAVEPELNVYRGMVAVATPSDFTPFGNGDVSETTTEFDIPEGQKLTVNYTGGSPGAVMSFLIEGWKEERFPSRF